MTALPTTALHALKVTPETARLLFNALTCKKQLHIIPGNGHMGHLDRHKGVVFALTADWLLNTLL